MNAPDLQPLIQVFTERILNTGLDGMVLAGLVWALLRLSRRQNSGTRFAIWFLALLAVAALPIFAGSGFGASRLPVLASANLRGEITLSDSCAFYLFAAWAIGAVLLLLRLSVGLWQVFRVRRSCQGMDIASLNPTVAAVFRDFGARCQTKLCVSKQVTAPAAIGFLRPAIVFPAWLLPQLSAAEVEVILLHENAHISRRDQWSNLVQKIVKAVFFFHPAVWWIESRLTLEREMACDDIVLAHSEPRAYASFLITFAEKLQNTRGLALVQALVSRMRQMSLRVTQILDAKRPRRTGLWLPVLGVNAGLLVLVIGTAPYVPHLVAFQNRPDRRQSQSIQALKAKDQPTVATVAFDSHSRVATPVVEGLASNSRPRAIAAGYKSRRGAASLGFVATPHEVPLQIRENEAQRRAPSQETIVILQTTQYDASGSGVWTLCIWRIKGGRLGGRELESAIASSI